MQPEAQTATRCFLAVSAGALEIAIVIQGALEGLSLYLFYDENLRPGKSSITDVVTTNV